MICCGIVLLAAIGGMIVPVLGSCSFVYLWVGDVGLCGVVAGFGGFVLWCGVDFGFWVCCLCVCWIIDFLHD